MASFLKCEYYSAEGEETEGDDEGVGVRSPSRTRSEDLTALDPLASGQDKPSLEQHYTLDGTKKKRKRKGHKRRKKPAQAMQMLEKHLETIMLRQYNQVMNPLVCEFIMYANYVSMPIGLACRPCAFVNHYC